MYPVPAVFCESEQTVEGLSVSIAVSLLWKWKVFDNTEVICKMDVKEVVQSFHPKLQPYIKEVLCSGNVGMYVLWLNVSFDIVGVY
jgi:hypothetical protein